MAQGKLAIKARIRSVDSTKKITKAMQLVASSKLKKQKQFMEENREYAHYLKEIVGDILRSLPKDPQNENLHPYLQDMQATNGKRVTIVFTSDMGLCGGYNANVLRMLERECEGDQVIMIGSRGVNWSKKREIQVIKELVDLDDDCYNELAQLGDELTNAYRNQQIVSIRILYTKFINSVSFEPEWAQLLPIADVAVDHETDSVEIDFEPSGEAILDTLIPMYVRSLLYSYYLQTKTSEQASRRMAMESATDNAEEIKETLELQYNQARQAAITQEITEIVGGVNALA